mgnify:CR=1 FL=1
MFDVTYKGHAIAAAAMNDKAMAYLLQYGFAQSLQDCVAGLAKEMREKGDLPETSEKAIESAMAERSAAILAGTVGHRVGGPRLSGLDKTVRDIAVEHIRAALATKKLSAPKGEAWQALVAAYTKKHSETLVPLAEARMAEQADLIEGALDGLL